MNAILFFKKAYLPIVLLFTICACSSSNDSQDPLPTPSPSEDEVTSVVGEWYDDQSTDNSIEFSVANYHQDGTFSMKTVTCSASKNMNFLINSDGSYQYKNGYLIENHTQTGILRYKVNSLTKYTLTTELDNYGAISYQHKLINHYKMNVGDERKFVFSDFDFNIKTYKSSNSRIATVDSNGNIVAKKRGEAYILASNGLESVAIQVIINDEDFIEDYTVLLGKTTKEITQELGGNYNIKKDGDFTTYHYYVYDDCVSQLTIGFQNDKVEQIDVRLTGAKTWEETYKLLNSKYINIGQTDEGFAYSHQNGGYKCFIFCNEKEKALTYIYSYDELNEYDQLKYNTIDDVAKKYNVKDNLDEDKDGDGENVISIPLKDSKYFTSLAISYNIKTREIKTYILYGKNDLDVNELDSWYRQRYYFLNADDYVFGDNKNIQNCNWWVLFRKKESTTNIMYYRILK